MNHTNNSTARELQHGKEGLIRSFLTVVIGVLILSYLGFDLRSRVVQVQNEYGDEISAVEAFIQGTLIPVGKDIFDSSVEVAKDNQLNKETFSNFTDLITTIKESLFKTN